MYSTNNEGKSGMAERFIRTLKNRIYKDLTSISKNVNIDKLGDMVSKYNKTYHSTIKMKPVDINLSTYIDSSKDIVKLIVKLVILLEYQNIKTFLQKAMYIPNLSGENFVIKKVKNIVPWIYVISDLNCWNVVRKRISKNKLKKV